MNKLIIKATLAFAASLLIMSALPIIKIVSLGNSDYSGTLKLVGLPIATLETSTQEFSIQALWGGLILSLVAPTLVVLASLIRKKSA